MTRSKRPHARSHRSAPALFVAALLMLAASSIADAAAPRLNEAGYFASRGLDVLAFNNTYDGNFSDSKIAGIELIHHGVRTATNGDVRLSPTPEQWDPVATLVERTVDAASGTVSARMRYDAEDFEYVVRVSPRDDGVAIQVVLDAPLPAALANKAGFNLEFLPSAYFGKSWLVDGHGSGQLPLYPSGPSGRRTIGAGLRIERKKATPARSGSFGAGRTKTAARRGKWSAPTRQPGRTWRSATARCMTLPHLAGCRSA